MVFAHSGVQNTIHLKETDTPWQQVGALCGFNLPYFVLRLKFYLRFLTASSSCCLTNHSFYISQSSILNFDFFHELSSKFLNGLLFPFPNWIFSFFSLCAIYQSIILPFSNWPFFQFLNELLFQFSNWNFNSNLIQL